MTAFRDTYLGRLRQRIGHDLVVLPGVQVVVIDADDRLLVQRRTDNGLWELPSGACEPGESFLQTAVTEVFEETGLQLSPDRLVPFATSSAADAMTIHYPNGDKVQAYALCFLARLDAGEEEAIHARDGEALEHRWVIGRNLPEPAMPSSSAVLELFRRYETGGAFQAS